MARVEKEKLGKEEFVVQECGEIKSKRGDLSRTTDNENRGFLAPKQKGAKMVSLKRGVIQIIF